jgi:AraC-like DNA-binding protein
VYFSDTVWGAMELPLLNEKRYAPYKVAALVEVLGEQGIAPEASLSGTGLSAKSLSDPETRTSVLQYITVCRNALQLSKTSETPFLTGSRIPLSAYGMYGFALVCSPTIREYFQVAIKYHRLATPLLAMSWREEDDYVAWTFPMNAAVTYPDALLRFLVEQQLTQLSTHLREVLEDDSYLPIGASLSYSAPSHAHLYKRYLGCPVRFDEPMSKLSYPKSILSAKPRLAHGLTSKILRDTCDRILGEVKTSTGVAGDVYQIIASTPGHSPSMEHVARQLTTTVRTLNRKLHAEGTSFTQILDDVRCNLATEYLRSTSLSIEDIAELVGFSEATNFRHAFRRWTGSTPARYRP